MTDQSTQEANKKFWLEMTKLGTEAYCTEMLKLSVQYCEATPLIEVRNTETNELEKYFSEEIHQKSFMRSKIIWIIL